MSLNWEGFNRNWVKFLPRLTPLLITFFFPFLECIAVFVLRNKLDDKYWSGLIGAIWKGSNYKKDWINGLVKPIMLIRRVLFIALPFTFNGYVYFQCQFLLFINLFYTMYYAAYRPEAIGNGKFRMELINEFLIIVISYVMMTFTHFV